MKRLWIAAAALALSPLPASADAGYYGKTGVYRGERTTAGDFVGSWVYVNRDQRWAFWIRNGKDGLPELKVQFQSTSSPEGFETDWSGHASYYLAGKPVTFSIELTKRTADDLEGKWVWDAEFGDSARTQTSSFTVHRVGVGRSFVLEFGKDYELVVRRPTGVDRFTDPPVWGFTKASKRLALWDELPF